MNLQHIFSSILSLFFMGKSTHSIQEKVTRASGMRTFAYFVLTWVVGVFFYKTYQVKTISNGIEITPLVGAYDSLGVCGDTIHKLNIFHKLDGGGIYQSFKIPDDGDNSSGHQDKGGFFAEIWSPMDKPFSTKINPHLSDEDLKLYNDNLKLDSYRTCYNFSMTNIQPPSLFPFSLIELADTTISDKGYNFHFFSLPLRGIPSEAFNENNNDLTRLDLNNGSVTIASAGIQNDFPVIDGYNYYITKISTKSSDVNRYNIFTSADISQFSYVLSVKSDLVIDRILVDFDQPIEILDNDSCVQVNPMSFVVKGSKVDSMRCKSEVLMYHVKLPTNSNMQLIRSLFLTTILTALIALFFSNLYYVIRKYVQDYYKRHKLPVKTLRKLSRKRVQRFRLLKNTLYVTGLSMLFGSYILVALDIPILLLINYIWRPILILVVCLSFIFYILYKVYKYAVAPVGRDKKKKLNK